MQPQGPDVLTTARHSAGGTPAAPAALGGASALTPAQHGDPEDARYN